MARYSFKKGSKEWNMMGDFFRICENFWIPPSEEESDEYWDEFIKVSEEFSEKYDHNRFATALMVFLMGFKDEEAKEAEHG